MDQCGAAVNGWRSSPSALRSRATLKLDYFFIFLKFSVFIGMFAYHLCLLPNFNILHLMLEFISSPVPGADAKIKQKKNNTRNLIGII